MSGYLLPDVSLGDLQLLTGVPNFCLERTLLAHMPSEDTAAGRSRSAITRELSF